MTRTHRRSLPALVALAALAAIVLMIAGAGRASGHETLDQTLTGNPDCTAEFGGTLSSSGEIYQEFVPSLEGLVAVDVCVSTGPDPRTIDINIRRGTVAAPGAVLAAGSAAPALSARQWLHIDLGSVLPVTPGEKLLLEIPESLDFSWAGTCVEIHVACTVVHPDLYPAGVGSFYGGTHDFLFRSYGTDDPTISRFWADLNCSEEVTPDDGLMRIQASAGLPVQAAAPGCPSLDEEVMAGGESQTWGNVDCGNDPGDIYDALSIFMYLANLSYAKVDPCPEAGDPVEVTG